MPGTMDLTAEELATWLVERAPDRLWAIDGEEQIEMTLFLPCSGTELAAELKRRGGRLRLWNPSGPVTQQRSELGFLSPAANVDGDEISFHAAWLINGKPGREWLIVTDVLAEEATRSAHAS